MKEKPTLKGPVLIMVRGLPGSGKSYLSAALEKTIGTKNVVMLDPDKINPDEAAYLEFSNNLSKEGLDKAIHPFRWLRKKACDGVTERKVVIWNQPFTARGIFDRLVTFIEQHTYATGFSLPVLVVEVHTDYEIAKKRIEDRKNSGGHGPSNNVFEQRASEYASFSDGYNTVEINGNEAVEISVNYIVHKLQTLLRD